MTDLPPDKVLTPHNRPMFSNRIQAGQLLATHLAHYKNDPNALVLAIPRGGVMTGFVVAQKLELPLEIELIKKVGHPNNAEIAIGAVSQHGSVIAPNPGVTASYLEIEIQRIKELLQEQHQMYLGPGKVLSVKGKVIILVDDGIATGHTMELAIQMVKSKLPKRIVVATPVAPATVIAQLSKEVDEVICLESPDPFIAVGASYKHFHPVKDFTVIRLLKDANNGFHPKVV